MKEKDLIAMFNKITINGNREMTQERFIQAVNELMAIKSTRRSERRANGSNSKAKEVCELGYRPVECVKESYLPNGCKGCNNYKQTD